MSQHHIVQNGDSVESIAFANGLFWETVWNHAENAPLRRLRDNPNILEEGDTVYVPDKRTKTETRATDQRHRFRRRGVPSVLYVRLLDEDDEPRSGLSYTVVTKQRSTSGVTDSEGMIRCFLMPDVREGTLRIESTGETYPFAIGTVNPVESVHGLHTRLHNLGYYDGPIDNELNGDSREALRLYQADHNLPETGEFDDATRAALLSNHLS